MAENGTHDFIAVPILTDAIQDAKCGNTDIPQALPRRRAARSRVLGVRSGSGTGVIGSCASPAKGEGKPGHRHGVGGHSNARHSNFR